MTSDDGGETVATSMPKKLSMRSNGRILGRKSESQKGTFLRQVPEGDAKERRRPTVSTNISGKSDRHIWGISRAGCHAPKSLETD